MSSREEALMEVAPVERCLVPYKWELIGLLWLCYFFNQADRQVYSVVLPALSEDLQLTPVQAGLVASIFMWTYAVLVPVAGYAGDVFRRKWIVFWSLLIWSMATLLSGVSMGLTWLVFFRGLSTGGGEAFYYPSANSLIGQYHQKTRALAMSIHQTSGYAGIVVSGLVAGWIAENYGWRMSFYAFGAIGLVLAAVILVRVKDIALPAPEAGSVERPPLWTVAREVGRKPTVWILGVAFAGFNFVGWGYFTWMSTFLHEKYELSLTDAGFASMFYSNLFALIGVLAGGRLSDTWAPRRRTLRMEVECLGLFCGVPFIALMGLTDHLWLCYAGTSRVRVVPRDLRFEPVRRAVRRDRAAVSGLRSGRHAGHVVHRGRLRSARARLGQVDDRTGPGLRAVVPGVSRCGSPHPRGHQDLVPPRLLRRTRRHGGGIVGSRKS